MTERRVGARGRRVARGIALAGLLGVVMPAGAHAAITVSGAGTVAEGGPGGTAQLVFTISRGGGLLQQAASVRVRTTGGTAAGGVDFTAVSGRVTVPGSLLGTSVDVVVPIVGDLNDEFDETVQLTIDQPEGDTIAGGAVTVSGTIGDDDAPPTLSLGDGSGAEGTGAPGRVDLPVAVSVPSGKPITAPFDVVAGTAAGADIDLADGTVTIPAGAAAGVASVATVGDDVDEADETFTVALGDATGATVTDGEGTGTVVNDDVPVGAIASIGGPEGTNPGPTPFVFPVTLSNPSERTISFRVRTADGQAAAPGDYATLDELVTFAPGETAKTVTVAVVGDGIAELDEAFGIGLSDPVGGAIGAGSFALGVIVNDDAGAVVLPGGSGATPIPFGTTPPAFDPVADRTDPRLRVTALGLRRPRTLRATVTCPASETSCRGTVTVFNVPNAKAKNRLLRRETRFGRASYSVAGGAKRTVTMRVTKAGLRMLRSAGRVRVRAFGVARDPAGNVGTATRTATIGRLR